MEIKPDENKFFPINCAVLIFLVPHTLEDLLLKVATSMVGHVVPVQH